MAQQLIGIGAAPDDETGDALRVAFDKTNDNFTELFAAVDSLGAAAFEDTGTSGHVLPFLDGVNTWSGAQTINADLSVAGNASIGSAYTGVAPPVNGFICQGPAGFGTSNPHYDVEIASVTGGQLDLRNTDSTAGGVTVGTVLGGINFSGTDSIAPGDFQTAAAIRGLGAAAWTATSSTQRAELAFFTQSNGDTGLLQRAVIDAFGRFGINVVGPTAYFHIQGASSSGAVGFKLGSAGLLTTPEAAAIENDGTNLYYTDDAGTRHTLAVV